MVVAPFNELNQQKYFMLFTFVPLGGGGESYASVVARGGIREIPIRYSLLW